MKRLMLFTMMLAAVIGHPIALNAHTFSSTVARNNVLVLFHTSWCKNCRPVREVFERLSYELRREDVLVATLDAESQRTVAHKESIRSFPSVYLYRHGERDRYEGNRKYEDILRFISSRITIVQSV